MNDDADAAANKTATESSLVTRNISSGAVARQFVNPFCERIYREREIDDHTITDVATRDHNVDIEFELDNRL
jgi:Flp pilus assembly protein TadG